MARFGFVGGSYQSQSVNADAQMTMNWIPEINESGAGKGPIPMYPSPGLKLIYTLGNDPVRGEITFAGRSFAAAGTTLFELLVGGGNTPFAGLVNDGQPVTMVGGGVPGALQILIASAGNGYVFDLQANTLTQVPPAMQVGPWATVAYIDEFFIALIKNSSEFQISNITNANVWSLADVSQVELIPDLVVSMLADHRELWLWGPKNTVVYYDSGDPLFPFSPIPGAFLEQGSAALLGAVRADNSVFWLGADERGAGIVWRAQGYSPVRVSNFALETALAGYNTISDAVAYTYQENGHTFCVWNFPSADKTWIYDVSTGMWHQRGFWNTTSGIFNRHLAQNHTFNFGQHLVGDYKIGKVYQMSSGFFDDNGATIRRVRRAPHISSEQEWIFHHQLQVDFETGLGLAAGQGSDPQAMLRWSDDGGHTWSNLYQVSAGPIGQYKARSIWRRLGRSRDRVYELSVSDPIPWRVVDAYLQATPGYVPTERISTQLRKSA